MRSAPLSAALLCIGPISVSVAADSGAVRQSASDAWWTGPLLAQSASTLPAGHFDTEPHFYDNIPYVRFDGEGRARGVPGEDELGWSVPMKYGVTDTLAVGATLRFGYDRIAGGASSSGIGLSDPSVKIQYRLTEYQPDTWIPTLSVNLEESLPLGRYDRLDRQTDGFGTGSNITTVATCFQTFFWMPNGRIVRARLDLAYAIARPVWVEGRSVYGTPDDFRGHVTPGDSASIDFAFEYSATRNWVLAADLWIERDADTLAEGVTRAEGSSAETVPETASFLSGSGSGRELIVAPAVEYNWSSRVGIILGVRVTAVGRNETGFITPMVALSDFL